MVSLRMLLYYTRSTFCKSFHMLPPSLWSYLLQTVCQQVGGSVVTLLNYLLLANCGAPSAILFAVSPSWNDPDFSLLTPILPNKTQHLKLPPPESLPRLWFKTLLLCLFCLYHSTHYLHLRMGVHFFEYELLQGKTCLLSLLPKHAWWSSLIFNIQLLNKWITQGTKDM